MNETKFSGMGKLYAQFRPSYPTQFIDHLFKNIGMTEDSSIADIGSGTGILTRQLLEKGCGVYGVEPNADMREVAEAALKEFSRFISINGNDRNTTLDSNSIDFITVAQAFHWFDRQAFKQECQRILKKDGQVILVWNSRDSQSGLVRENDEINRKYCPNFKGFAGGVRGDQDDFSDFFTGTYEIKTFRNDLVFDLNSFVGRNLSASYAPKETDENYHQYIEELTVLFKKYSEDGLLAMPNLTNSYIGNV